MPRPTEVVDVIVADNGRNCAPFLEECVEEAAVEGGCSFSGSILSLSYSKAQAGSERIGRRRGRRRGGLTILWHAEAGDGGRASAVPLSLNVQITRNNTTAQRPAVCTVVGR